MTDSQVQAASTAAVVIVDWDMLSATGKNGLTDGSHDGCMGMRIRTGLAVVLLALVGAGAFWLGRATAGPPMPADRGYATGHSDGLREGRAEQATLNLPATDKAVFDAGYTAGAADVFTGFDGGWDRNVPYVIVLAPGGGGVTYRIQSRTRLEPGVNYYLCPDGHTLCRGPR
jgi:hypothetical protein